VIKKLRFLMRGDNREKPAREQKQIMEQRRYYGITRESFVFWEEFPSTPE